MSTGDNEYFSIASRLSSSTIPLSLCSLGTMENYSRALKRRKVAVFLICIFIIVFNGILIVSDIRKTKVIRDLLKAGSTANILIPSSHSAGASKKLPKPLPLSQEEDDDDQETNDDDKDSFEERREDGNPKRPRQEQKHQPKEAAEVLSTCYTINHPSTYGSVTNKNATTTTRNTTSFPARQQQIPVWVIPDHFRQHEIQHFLRDGVEQSPLLMALNGEKQYKTHEVDRQSTIWLVDQNRMGFRTTSKDDTTPRFCRKVHEWATKRQTHIDVTNSSSSYFLSTSWMIHFIDWRDTPYKIDYCSNPNFISLMGKDNIRYHKRSIVVNRTFNPTTNTIMPGYIRSEFKSGSIDHAADFSSNEWENYTSVKPRHVPYAVRTDTVRELYSIVQRRYKEDMEKSCLDLASISRSKDVVHYWPIKTPPKIDKMSGHSAHWREIVSRGIQEWAADTTYTMNANKNNSNNTSSPTTSKLSTPTIVVYTDFAGDADNKGRSQVSSSYVESMLEYKIVVVCQRNKYEDHYRLFEALVSGALVFTDTMLSLPQGLESDVNIIVYDNIRDLQNKLSWYLHPTNATLRQSIARKGRDISMRRHRSWHRVEDIIFGSIQS